MVESQYKAKDEQLFAEVQKLMDGKYDSYEQVYELSKKYIYKIINDIVQNHHTTEDMMQETYIQIYNKIGTLRDARSFYVWAGRIASNLTLRHLQKYRKEYIQSASGEDDEDFMFDKLENDHEAFIPETVLENQEQQRIIAGIIDELSPEQKLTVQYYYFEEMSVNDIAETMECSTGTVKSRLNYARKSLKDAVSKFEKSNDVKLYSISGLPIFYLVFRAASEGWSTSAGAAAVAGVASNVAGNALSEVSGGVGDVLSNAGNALSEASNLAEGVVANAGSAAAKAGGVVADASGIVGAGSAAGASSAAAGTVAASTMVASTTAAAAGGGFLTTIVGKVVVVVVTVVVGVGSATTAATVNQNNLINSGRYEEVMEQVETSKSQMVDLEWIEMLMNNAYMVPGDVQEEKPSTDAIYELLGGSEENMDAYANEIDEDYITAIDNLAAAMVRYQRALEYSLTPEQSVYVQAMMAGYMGEIENYLATGVGYTQLMTVDTSGSFANNYYPRLIEILEREAVIIDGFASIYSKDEVKSALSNYTAADLEAVLQMGGGIGDLIAYDLSEDIVNELVYYTQDLMSLLTDIETLSNEMVSDPALSQYIQ